jgi:hypothetical protein
MLAKSPIDREWELELGLYSGMTMGTQKLLRGSAIREVYSIILDEQGME